MPAIGSIASVITRSGSVTSGTALARAVALEQLRRSRMHPTPRALRRGDGRAVVATAPALADKLFAESAADQHLEVDKDGIILSCAAAAELAAELERFVTPAELDELAFAGQQAC